MPGNNRGVSKWEDRLWFYLSQGDGEHCPFYAHCQARKKGLLCADEARVVFNQLLDADNQFDPHKFNLTFPKAEEYNESSLFYLVERLAQKYLKMGRVCQPPVPAGLVVLADDQHPVEVRQPSLKAYHGAIWRLRERWVIQLKNDDTSTDKRFTLFHEAFHILAHRGATPVFRKRGNSQGSFNELLADFFAVCILMPKQWVMEKWAEVHDLNQMAEVFDAPEAAMWFRLKQLGLI